MKKSTQSGAAFTACNPKRRSSASESLQIPSKYLCSQKREIYIEREREEEEENYYAFRETRLTKPQSSYYTLHSDGLSFLIILFLSLSFAVNGLPLARRLQNV